MKQEDLVTDPFLRIILDKLVKRSKKGIMTVVVVFGATRSGKSYNTMCYAKYCAMGLQTPFTNENIIFGVDKLPQKIAGKYQHVYQIDEGALDLLSSDRFNIAQKELIKYHMMGAKYGQIIFVLIQKLTKLPETIVTDPHTRLINMYLNKDLNAGNYKVYAKNLNSYIYYLMKTVQYKKLAKIKPLFRGYSKLDINLVSQYIDINRYENEKDDAILSISAAKTDKNAEFKAKMFYKLKNEHNYTTQQLADMCGLEQNTVAYYIRMWAKSQKEEGL